MRGSSDDPEIDLVETTRLEALSDGTFAIIITLLVLEIRPAQRSVTSEKNLFKRGRRISLTPWPSSM